MLSGDELDAFRKLSQSEKRDVVQEMLRKAANSAIDAEIIDYFMSEIRVQGGTFSTLSQRHLTIAFLLLSDQPAVL